MPPRFAYWTIIVGDQPTAFRAATRDELLPTLKQLQSKQPDAVLKWFSRGRLWESPAEATQALREQRRGAAGERRSAAWRPGGRHEDPRERFKIPRDVKRQRFAARLRRDKDKQDDGDARPERPQGERRFGRRGAPAMPNRGGRGGGNRGGNRGGGNRGGGRGPR